MATAAEKKVAVQIERPGKVWMKMRLTGTTRLVVNNKQSESMKDMLRRRAQGENVSTKGKVRDFEKEFQDSRYLDDKGRDCVPSMGIKKSIMAAAGEAKCNVSMADIGRLIDVNPGLPLTPLNGGTSEPVMREDIVSIGGVRKTPEIRYRAAYEQWSVDVEVGFPKERISPEVMADLVTVAGELIGLCEGRLQKGSFGWGAFKVDVLK